MYNRPSFQHAVPSPSSHAPVFMDDVPSDWTPSQGAPDCTASEAAPAADLALATPLLFAAATYLGIGLAVEDDVCGDTDIGPPRPCAIGGVSFLAAVPHAWSGLRGASIARRCRDAKREAREWDALHPVMTASARRDKAMRRAAVSDATSLPNWITTFRAGALTRRRYAADRRLLRMIRG